MSLRQWPCYAPDSSSLPGPSLNFLGCSAAGTRRSSRGRRFRLDRRLANDPPLDGRDDDMGSEPIRIHATAVRKQGAEQMVRETVDARVGVVHHSAPASSRAGPIRGSEWIEHGKRQVRSF